MAVVGMMGLSRGVLITGISIIGILGSITALAVTGKFFARKRKKLLESIEME